MKAPEYIQTLQNTNININHDPPDISEIKNVLLTLKNGKASNDIPAEFPKYATDSAELLAKFKEILLKSGRIKLYHVDGHTQSWLLSGKVLLKEKYPIQKPIVDYKCDPYSAKSWL